MQRLVRKRAAVPRFVRLFALETEIRAEIDERLALRVAFRRKVLRKTVRQRRKDHVALFDDLRLRAADEIAQAAVSGVYVRKRHALEAHRADRRELRRGMQVNQAADLRPGVSGCADNADFYLFHFRKPSLPQFSSARTSFAAARTFSGHGAPLTLRSFTHFSRLIAV